MSASPTSNFTPTNPLTLEDGMLLVGSLILLALLVLKEVVNGSTDPQLRRLDHALSISLFPMLGAFFLLLIIKAGEFLH